jgi:hypothetical protein
MTPSIVVVGYRRARALADASLTSPVVVNTVMDWCDP